MPFTQNQSTTFVFQPQFASLVIGYGATAFAPFSLYPGGPNGSKAAGSILIANTDTIAHDVILSMNTGGTVGAGNIVSGGVVAPLNTVSAPISCGVISSVPPANLLSGIFPVDSDGNPYVFVPIGGILVIQLPVTLATTGKQVSIAACAIGDF